MPRPVGAKMTLTIGNPSVAGNPMFKTVQDTSAPIGPGDMDLTWIDFLRKYNPGVVS